MDNSPPYVDELTAYINEGIPHACEVYAEQIFENGAVEWDTHPCPQLSTWMELANTPKRKRIIAQRVAKFITVISSSSSESDGDIHDLDQLKSIGHNAADIMEFVETQAAIIVRAALSDNHPRGRIIDRRWMH